MIRRSKMKSKFDIVFEQVMSMITEGGHAVANVSKIKRENIQPTLQKIEEMIMTPLNISKDFWTAEIGSAGKKDYSGDLDIAIDFAKAAASLKKDPKEFKNEVFEKLKDGGYSPVRYAANISFNFPIQGDQEGEGVQVDFFPSNNLEFTKFRMHSPTQEASKYKGVHRFALLASLVKAVSLAVADDAIDKEKYTAPDGRVYPAYRFKQLTVLDDGVFQVTKSFMGKSGKFVKAAQKDPSQSKLVTTNPQELLDMLFGKNKYNIDDLDSFESIWNNILFDSEFPYPDKRDEIIIAVWHSINDMSDIAMPKELQDYVDEHNLI